MTTTLALEADQELVVERARRFVDEELIPREVAAELAGGRLPASEIAAIRAATIAAGLNGGLHAVEHGGQGWSHLTWVLVEEQLGRATNGISWWMPNAYNVWSAASPEQIDRWLRPVLRGEGGDAYAVTEEHAGSDPSGIATTAEPVGDGWRIRGDKWFVTTRRRGGRDHRGGSAPRRAPTLFAVPTDTPGITTIDDPPYTHNYPHGHPTLRFGVEVGPEALIGPLGGGDDLQREWFLEERLGIAARGIGAMERLLTETLAWATGASRAARGSGTTRACRSRSRTPPPTRPPAACWCSRSRGWPTPAPTSRSSTRRRRWRSCSSARRRAAARTAPCRRSAGAATAATTSPSGCCASCASTASGRGRARSSG